MTVRELKEQLADANDDDLVVVYAGGSNVEVRMALHVDDKNFNVFERPDDVIEIVGKAVNVPSEPCVVVWS